ncbi:MAG TPA: VOC family protein [Dongiaceae bacterium]|nr:VOC family protein [Dongiaceae bacterium]
MFLLLLAALTPAANAQLPPSRPKITGIAGVRVYAANLDVSRDYYQKILGFTKSSAGCMGVPNPCYAVNGHQRIELAQISAGTPDNLLAEVAFATSDLDQMYAYLRAHNVAVKPIARDSSGLRRFQLLDPEGHPLAFVEQPADRFFTPTADQVSTRLLHAGFIVKDRAALDRFYRDLLGFRMYWHGGFKDQDVDWEELQVPDGSDWIEYMLNIPENADQKERGVQNHFSLGVAKIQSTFERLKVHGLKPAPDDKPEIGRDGKWSWDIYDPNFTRIEFMEFKPAQQPCCHPYEAPHPTP